MALLTVRTMQAHLLFLARWVLHVASRAYLSVSDALRRQFLAWLGVPPDYFAAIIEGNPLIALDQAFPGAVLSRLDNSPVAVASTASDPPTAIIPALFSPLVGNEGTSSVAALTSAATSSVPL